MTAVPGCPSPAFLRGGAGWPEYAEENDLVRTGKDTACSEVMSIPGNSEAMR